MYFMADRSDKKKKLIFILSAAHSGSTLLDKSLGSHPDCFSMGEIINFAEEWTKERTLCGCGKWLKDCSFWRTIENRLLNQKNIDITSLKDFDIKIESNTSFLSARLATIRRFFVLLNKDERRKINRTRLLYNTIAEVGEVSILIDSSKDILRSYYLSKVLKEHYESYFIHLVRNGKAVLNSRKKKSYSVTTPDGKLTTIDVSTTTSSTDSIVKSWVKYNKKAQTLLRLIPSNKQYFIRHEDFIHNPTHYTKAICTLLNIKYSENMVFLTNENNHIMAGNPSRVNATKINPRTDKKFSNLSDEDLKIFEDVAGTFQQRLGYI